MGLCCWLLVCSMGLGGCGLVAQSLRKGRERMARETLDCEGWMDGFDEGRLNSYNRGIRSLSQKGLE